MSRGIFPVIFTATSLGVQEISAERVSVLSKEMLQRRLSEPNVHECASPVAVIPHEHAVLRVTRTNNR